MARHSSKTLLREIFTGSNDFESFVTHVEFLSQLRKWQRKETVNGAETEVDDHSQFFGLKISIVNFRRALGRAMLRP